MDEQHDIAPRLGSEITAFAQVDPRIANLGLAKPKPGISDAALDNWFTHHPPTHAQVEQYNTLRMAAFQFAKIIRDTCPPSADTTTAIRKVREAVMIANASIACAWGANG